MYITIFEAYIISASYQTNVSVIWRSAVFIPQQLEPRLLAKTKGSVLVDYIQGICNE